MYVPGTGEDWVRMYICIPGSEMCGACLRMYTTGVYVCRHTVVCNYCIYMVGADVAFLLLLGWGWNLCLVHTEYIRGWGGLGGIGEGEVAG